MVKVADGWNVNKDLYVFCSIECACYAGKFHIQKGWIHEQEGKTHHDSWHKGDAMIQEERSSVGTRRIVMVPARSGEDFNAYLEILQENGHWEASDHLSVDKDTFNEYGTAYAWSYFSSSVELADPIRHSREEVFRDVGLKPWEK